MRIALCTEIFNPSFGGVEKRVYETTRRMEKKGIRVDIYTSSEITEETSRFHIKQVSPFTIIRPPKRSFVRSLRFWLALIRELRKNEYDIIDANGHLVPLPCSIAGMLRKKPVIATIHDLYLKDWKYMAVGASRYIGQVMENLMCRFPYTKIITVNTSLKKAFHDKFKIPEDKVLVVPNGITIKEIDAIKAGKRNDNTILFVGRLVPQKNVELLIKAFSEALKKIPGLKLEIVGDGFDRKRLESLSKELGVSKSTVFLGAMKNSEVLKKIKESTIFVMPSKRESFGITILEAMACHTPVISTATEGPLDYIMSENNGFLTRLGDAGDGDASEMGAKIVLLAKNKALRKKIAANARKTAESYDWDKITDRLINIFRDTVKRQENSKATAQKTSLSD
jgi:glycosyltransferase involved in cell wall biosynthesis